VRSTSNFPRSVDFITTSDCNLKCNVCWGSQMPAYETLPLSERRRFIDILEEEGVSQAVFSGGEPLLDSDLPELLKYAQGKMKTWLFTNAMLLSQKQSEVLPYSDRVSFSLDGPTEEMNAIARREGHYAVVLEGLKILRERYSGIITRVLSVVTKQNKGSLLDIGNLLEREKGDLEFSWKLNFYQPIGRFNERFMLTYGEFEDIANGVVDSFRGRMDVKYSVPEHDLGYLFVMADGQMYTPVGSQYVHVGLLQNKLTHDTKTLAVIRDNLDARAKRIAKQGGIKNGS
jgi:MoaA/NifB/PqqE/SkfB family radical SAM enzyme